MALFIQFICRMIILKMLINNLLTQKRQKCRNIEYKPHGYRIFDFSVCSTFSTVNYYFSVFRYRGRKNDQPRDVKPHGYWVLVPSTLKFLKIDSLYVHIGEAVRYNWQTVRVWRLWVSPSIHGESGVKQIKTRYCFHCGLSEMTGCSFFYGIYHNYQAFYQKTGVIRPGFLYNQNLFLKNAISV